jgi:bifunctional non-homologous end joining protein LigD
MRVEHEMSRRTDQDIEVQTAVVFTHTDKILFPEAGITKGEVLSFYERISERLLPHLRERPVTLERFPEGVTDTAAPHFW